MTSNEFRAKLKTLPVAAPDAADEKMLLDAAKINDGTVQSLDELKDELDGYSGRLVLRIPRSLHKTLKEAAEADGVSLNQYMLYKLAR